MHISDWSSDVCSSDLGVNVRLKAVFELKAQFCQDGQIPSDRFEDRVDKHGPFRIAASDQIGVGRGLLFEELPEDHPPACPMQGAPASITSSTRLNPPPPAPSLASPTP